MNKLKLLIAVLCLATCGQLVLAGQATPSNPILFVTQVPVPPDFVTIGSVFGNHQSDVNSAARGGDLMIRYPDGTLKNLTLAAGFGSTGQQQGANSIAVRDPAVHWSGTKAIFSMVIGAPAQKFDYTYQGFWQLYEITGFGQAQTPVITKVPKQPTGVNNISPIYGTDERIIFTSDRPRNGAMHLYPPRDEYELAPVVSGIWSLSPSSGNLFLMSHDPSGSFTPTIDSFGRVIFTRWDHLQRDQEADADAQSTNGTVYGTVNFPNETAGAVAGPRQEEFFPEPRPSRTDLLQGTNLLGHRFNQFFPWMINEDGTDQETLNHVGRHELFDYFEPSVTDDSNVDFFFPPSNRANKHRMLAMLQIKENPLVPGLYFGIEAPEFATHASGQIITLTGAKGLNPDQMVVNLITDPATAGYNADNAPADPNHSGHYRSPVPLTDGLLLAVHAPETRAEKNEGTSAAPISRYDFKIKMITAAGLYSTAGPSLTGGINKTVSYWSPDQLVTYTGPLWELDPVEVVARVKPVKPATPIPAPEQSVFDEEGVDMAALKSYMTQNNLALVVSRDMTTRDRADKQQPFNLRVSGTTTQSTPAPGKVYDISFLQFFQGDLLRGFTGGGTTIRPGRRVLATPMHDDGSSNPTPPNAPAGSVQIGTDGSMAAFVPANRAMTWQSTDQVGTPVVRERYWLSFQPGEIRTCTSCHGVNTSDQSNKLEPQNKPEALRTLMKFWKNGTPPPIAPGAPPVFSSAPTATPNPAAAGQSITFTAAATSATAVTYEWNFADASLTQAGASTNHTFAVAGVYLVSVKATDAKGKSTSATVQVVVTATGTGPGGNPGPGGNGNPGPGGNDNPGPGEPGEDPAPGQLAVKRAQLRFDFKHANNDSLILNGSILMPPGFSVEGKTATITIGSFNASAILSAKRNGQSITVQPVRKKGKKAAPSGVCSVTVMLKKQALFDAMNELGFSDDVAKPGEEIMLPVTLECDGQQFTVDVPILYSAKSGKSAAGAYKQ